MARKCYNTEEIMKERDQYPAREKKERKTGQDLQNGANGKRRPGGPRSEGKKR